MKGIQLHTIVALSGSERGNQKQEQRWQRKREDNLKAGRSPQRRSLCWGVYMCQRRCGIIVGCIKEKYLKN